MNGHVSVPILSICGVVLFLTGCSPAATQTLSPTSTVTLPPSATPSPSRPLPPTPTLIPTLTSRPPSATPLPGQTPLPPDYIDPLGVPMRAVPEADFIMGSDSGHVDDQPAHTVYLDAFYIDKYEVTNAFYKACVDGGGCVAPDQSPFDDDNYGHPNSGDYPMRLANWYIAKAYCEWRGACLPTEAEWEKAARGTDGRTYPWGQVKDCSRGNFENCQDGPTKVGAYESGKSPYGVYDMAGNVQEWVADWYSADYYSPSSNPQGPASGVERVLKSSHWVMREHGSAGRSWFEPDFVGKGTFGFRCARTTAP